ncbi:hypothetical protein [Brevibacterium aurantiacum]|nr:hypothetical protein [Brevibacterium aurantiacum]
MKRRLTLATVAVGAMLALSGAGGAEANRNQQRPAKAACPSSKRAS